VREPQRHVPAFRQTEVQDFHPLVTRDEDVLGLEIAVDDIEMMRGDQSARDFQGVGNRRPHRDGAVLQAAPERLAPQQFGDDIWHALSRSHVVNGDDVRVVDERRGARFLREPRQALGIRRDTRGENLQRDQSTEAGVARAVDVAHAAGGEEAIDLVGPQPVTRF
jgi:hypothetical protein